MGKFKVQVDRIACQGFGACAELCSQFFKLSDVDGKTTIEGSKKLIKENAVIAETLEIDKLECVRDAAETCPFNALHITDIETGEKLI